MSGIDTNLPVIDISPYLTPGNDEARALTSAALHSACLKYGFFYLNLSNYIDASEPEELISLARQFFSLPQEEKDKIGLANEDGARGEISSCLQSSMFDRHSQKKLQDTPGSRRT
jgi:isopenicillin N synthase-like dioxygenase